ncbi:MAG: hypothetical protein IJN04_07305 [Clostridia bacterium]|nr:hypothetical protein [Clostridia bacterium]
MFGYVRIFKPTIRMGEYEQYKGIYCTLCKRLGKRYGVLSRFTLSYDMTFLALLQMALEKKEADFCPSRCSFNPAKRCLKARNTAAIDRAADIGTILAYYKLRDTLADEGLGKKIGAWCALPFAKAAYKKAKKQVPQIDEAAAEMMAAQARAEADGTTSIDRAAEPFAVLLGYLAAQLIDDDTQKRVLNRFGYCLGRWVYLMDAVDDLAEDLQKGRYNPFIGAEGWTEHHTETVQNTRSRARLTLNACLAECKAAYELLEIRRFDGILRNILEEGMAHAQKRVTSGEEGKE